MCMLMNFFEQIKIWTIDIFGYLEHQSYEMMFGVLWVKFK
jgi:hypothetical protein